MNRKEDLINYLYEELFDPANEEIGFDTVISTIRKYEESPLTLADLLGWEENVEYTYKYSTYKLISGKLYHKYGNANNWLWEETSYGIDYIIDLQQATKVEPKQKAYHVKDEYSYNCLMEELEEQGYKWRSGELPTKSDFWRLHEEPFVLYTHKSGELGYGSFGYFNNYEKDNYDLVEYHKGKKLKAYHVTDEYSYNCLMKELEEQGFDMNFKKNPFVFEGEIYIFEEEEKKELGFSIIKLNKVLEKYDLIEYHKEEPKYYAKVKGADELNCVNVYWHFDTYEELLSVSDKDNTECYITLMTKTEWNKLGINNTNADFEEVSND